MSLFPSTSKTVCYICGRLREPSTWRGLTWLLTACGYSLTADQANTIVTAGMAIAGLIGVFSTDNRCANVNDAG